MNLRTLLSLGATCCLLAAPAVARPPNILLILADDLGYGDVGFHGCADIPTPHLDRLAASGVRFTNAYVSAPVCAPTRAGLLTGRYQQRFGFEFLPRREQGLPDGETLLSKRLQAAGYATGVLGKWHLGWMPSMHPQQHGFDEFYGFLAGHSEYFDARLLRGTDEVTEAEYLTDALGREAAAFVERHRDRPWFLFLSFNAVHDPMQATGPRLERFAHIRDERRRVYAAMTVAMDDAVGAVVQMLAATHQAETTLVIFANDNGGPVLPGTTRNGSSNRPLRGSKRTLLEGGIRVPQVISWPGRVKPGVFDHPVIQMDLTATALAAAGVDAPAAGQCDGVDLLPYLKADKNGAPHEALYWRIGEQMAIREGDWKLVRYDSNADTKAGGRNEPVTDFKLYHLANDLGETRDLSREHPEKVAALQARWARWNATLAEPLWDNRRKE